MGHDFGMEKASTRFTVEEYGAGVNGTSDNLHLNIRPAEEGIQNQAKRRVFEDVPAGPTRTSEVKRLRRKKFADL